VFGTFLQHHRLDVTPFRLSIDVCADLFAAIIVISPFTALRDSGRDPWASDFVGSYTEKRRMGKHVSLREANADLPGVFVDQGVVGRGLREANAACGKQTNDAESCTFVKPGAMGSNDISTCEA